MDKKYFEGMNKETIIKFYEQYKDVCKGDTEAILTLYKKLQNEGKLVYLKDCPNLTTFEEQTIDYYLQPLERER